jgi:chaperonin cofactor prefoldin
MSASQVLVKQELVEVKNNVTKRVEFIKNDITRLEGIVKKFEQQGETVKGNIAALQKSGAK